MKFKLVNPQIQGNFQSNVDAPSAEDAAKKIWNKLSKYLTNNVPRFGFTMKGGNGTLHHFMVKENVQGNMVDYEIEKFTPKIKKTIMNDFKRKIKGIEQQGGKFKKQYGGKKKDYEIDDYEMFKLLKKHEQRLLTQPIVYWWYDPLIYAVDTIYIPTFTIPLYPYVEIYMNSAFFI